MQTIKKTKYSAPALVKGFEILELLAQKRIPMSLVQISTALERSKSELYRMIAALEQMGYLARNEGSDYYHITNRLFELGLQVPPIGTLTEAAYPLMRELSSTIQQSCHITVESQDSLVVIAKTDNPASFGFAVNLGHHSLLHKSGSGYVLLANKSNKQLAIAIKRLAQLDDDLNHTDLMTLIEQVKSQGFAKTKSAMVQGLTDISYPIFIGDTGTIIGTLTIPYLKDKSSSLTMAQVQKHISETANQLSQLSLSYGSRV
ncbi:IclR family transcriptional regulator [Thalassotalea crassostreae]|uniref:IclR family transcriptional regulator n=1 Tax=Thalassotalea crassostreae TaxID=1763536 RepID=UPI000838095D|nr:helix-turn-helix domain-containing protein [Thalassotalea crassostreae]